MLDHKHLICTAAVRSPFVDPAIAENWLCRVVRAVNMKLVIGPFAHYCTAEGNNGITATCCIETSHASLHVWDKEPVPHCKFDLYSCATFEPLTVLEFLNEMDPFFVEYIILDRNISIREADRGVRMYCDPGDLPLPYSHVLGLGIPHVRYACAPR